LGQNTGEHGILILLSDITDLKMMEKKRSEYFANVSHELRTPLTSIRGFVETLQGGALEDKETALHFLDIMSKEANRLTRMLDELLVLSGVQEKRFVYRWQPVHFQKIISRVSTMFLTRVQDKNQDLIIDVPTELPAVHGDPDMLTQVLINLLDNAVKYTRDGGRIAVRAGTDGQKVWVKVEDNGIGIPGESLTRIFERFYRVYKARAGVLGGMGMGLAITKHIIKAHNGEIFVESKVGKGSVFTFTLPVEKNNQDLDS